MKQLSKITFALLILATVVLTTSCAASRKSSHCSCEGMIGYK